MYPSTTGITHNGKPIDVLAEPNLVMTKTDPPLAIMASLWFYMTPQRYFTNGHLYDKVQVFSAMYLLTHTVQTPPLSACVYHSNPPSSFLLSACACRHYLSALIISHAYFAYSFCTQYFRFQP